MTRHKLHKPKRVFVGLKLAEELEGAVLYLQSALNGIPARWIPPNDIHLTLVPPFETQDVYFARYKLRKALTGMHQFPLRFVRLNWGPNKERPHLIWVECAASQELIALKKKLLKMFEVNNVKEKVPFIPHMTLARLQKKDSERAARRRIIRRTRFSMDVVSVELFESPHRGGTGYTVFSSVPLQPKDGVPIWRGS